MKTNSKPVGALAAHSRYFELHRQDMIQTIRQMVEIESPSDDKTAVDQLGAWLAGRLEQLGGQVHFHKQQKVGNHVQADFRGKKKAKPILLLGHHDTVYPMGTLASMPCKVERGRLWGPGVFDMKTGIAFMLHAIDVLRDEHGLLPRPVTVLLVTDEEIGSATSRAITESLARKSEAVFVLEPSFGERGALKTSRKGVADYTVKVIGQASHAGLDPFKGQSAIHELALQIPKIVKMAQPGHGLTVSVGIIRGGTRVNVIAAEASADVDIRVTRLSDAAKIDRAMRALKPVNRKCKLQITGGLNRPPMERNKGVAALYAKAQALARSVSWKLEETAVGGGSDGNFTAALGIPTLDGLGAIGEGAHATHESISIADLPRRAALIAALIENI